MPQIAKDILADLCERAANGERVVFERDGKKYALIPYIDLELLQELEDKDDLEAAKAALEEPGENITLDRLIKELALNR